HAGGGEGSALHDPALRAGLDAVGLHNVVTLTALDNGVWTAGGWTWDRDGLHFDQMESVPAADRGGAGPKDPIRRSLREGMAIVGCVQRHAIDWRSLGSTLRLGAAGGGVAPTELASTPPTELASAPPTELPGARPTQLASTPLYGWPALDRP